MTRDKVTLLSTGTENVAILNYNGRVIVEYGIMWFMWGSDVGIKKDRYIEGYPFAQKIEMSINSGFINSNISDRRLIDRLSSYKVLDNAEPKLSHSYVRLDEFGDLIERFDLEREEVEVEFLYNERTGSIDNTLINRKKDIGLCYLIEQESYIRSIESSKGGVRDVIIYYHKKFPRSCICKFKNDLDWRPSTVYPEDMV